MNGIHAALAEANAAKRWSYCRWTEDCSAQARSPHLPSSASWWWSCWRSWCVIWSCASAPKRSTNAATKPSTAVNLRAERLVRFPQPRLATVHCERRAERFHPSASQLICGFKAKTDAIDAARIARFCRAKATSANHDARAAAEELRELVRLRERMTGDLG